jgi:hypothetical protein
MNKKRRKTIKTSPKYNLSWIHMVVYPDKTSTEKVGGNKVCEWRVDGYKRCETLERAGYKVKKQ